VIYYALENEILTLFYLERKRHYERFAFEHGILGCGKSSFIKLFNIDEVNRNFTYRKIDE
jgi:hypothetical protein